jgi:hypothetical protein
MKCTTMNLTWEQSRLTEVAVCGTLPRPTVRDSLWVSLMSARRSLNSTLEDRLMGFPRWPAARPTPLAKGRAEPMVTGLPRRRGFRSPAEDLAFIALGLSSFASLAWCFWQMCLSMS